MVADVSFLVTRPPYTDPALPGVELVDLGEIDETVRALTRDACNTRRVCALADESRQQHASALSLTPSIVFSVNVPSQ